MKKKFKTNQTNSPAQPGVQPMTARASKKIFREHDDESLRYKQRMLSTLEPERCDLDSLERIAVMVRHEISEAHFWTCLHAATRSDVNHRIGYFFGSLRRRYEDIHHLMAAIRVLPEDIDAV